jgi:hypothetical protein
MSWYAVLEGIWQVLFLDCSRIFSGRDPLRPEGLEPPTLCLEDVGREIPSPTGIAAYGQNHSEIRP